MITERSAAAQDSNLKLTSPVDEQSSQQTLSRSSTGEKGISDEPDCPKKSSCAFSHSNFGGVRNANSLNAATLSPQVAATAAPGAAQSRALSDGPRALHGERQAMDAVPVRGDEL